MSGWIYVTATWAQAVQAGWVGAQRHLRCAFNRTEARYGCPRNIAWQRNMEGAYGELALALHTGVPWPNASKAGDVGPYEVRASDSGASLITHPADADGKPYVMAHVGELPRLALLGWAWGRETKRPEFWRTRPAVPSAAYFTPWAMLRDMDTLPSVKDLEAGLNGSGWEAIAAPSRLPLLGLA